MTKDMTSLQSSIRDTIDDLGQTIVITPITLTLTGKYGDKTESNGTPVSTVGVPYTYFKERFNFIPVGDLVEGDMLLIIKDNETIAVESSNVRYKVTVDSVDYDVVTLEDYNIANLTVAKQLTLRKRI